jgi:hypothetical protein
MAIPTGGDIPSQYQPNPTDDRATGSGPTYLAIATAIEAIESIERRDPVTMRMLLDPQTVKALRSAESALRRAAFSLVIHHREG